MRIVRTNGERRKGVLFTMVDSEGELKRIPIKGKYVVSRIN